MGGGDNIILLPRGAVHLSNLLNFCFRRIVTENWGQPTVWVLCNAMLGHNIRENCLATTYARERSVGTRQASRSLAQPAQSHRCVGCGAGKSRGTTEIPFFELVTTLVLHDAFVDAHQKHHFVALGLPCSSQ